MVKLTKSRHRKVNTEIVGDFYHQFHHIPEEVNWIDEGFVTPTYNQKDCGSCYAFSIAGVLQGQVYKQTKKLVPLRLVRINLYLRLKFCSLLILVLNSWSIVVLFMATTDVQAGLSETLCTI